MLKTYQRETKLFEFSLYTNREESNLRKNDITLQWLCFNGFVAMVFSSFVLLYFQTELSSFLTTGHTAKYRPVVKDF